MDENYNVKKGSQKQNNTYSMVPFVPGWKTGQLSMVLEFMIRMVSEEKTQGRSRKAVYSYSSHPIL